MEKCCKGLGVSAALQVYAQLYKLLLYETGGHFVPHRDTEKVSFSRWDRQGCSV